MAAGRWARCLLVVAAALCQAGCGIGWRPARVEPTVVVPERPFALSDYLAANQVGRWRYERRELPLDDDEPPVVYVRTLGVDGVTEGHFVAHRLRPLPDYVQKEPVPTTQPAPRPSRPGPPLDAGVAILFRLDPPVTPIPESLSLGGSDRTETTIRDFNGLGRMLAIGKLVRTVVLEGIETVEVPAGVFADCLRVRVKLEVSFPWGPVFELTTYLWLSPDVGEVRRVQHISGLFWILYFESAHQFDLASYEPRRVIGGELPPPAPEWEWGAVLFDRTFPKPQISGMRVEYAASRPAG